MDQITEMLDVPKPTLYKYYKNKQELLHACHEKATDRFLELARESMELDGTALDKIKHYQYRSVEFYTDEFGRALSLSISSPSGSGLMGALPPRKYAISSLKCS